MVVSSWRFAAVLPLILAVCSTAMAQVHVKGYTRKDGTHVPAHSRSRQDGIFANNWTTIGNVNPYTGQPGTRRTPPTGDGGFDSLAASSYGVAPYSPSAACNQSRGQMFASASSPSIGGSGSLYEPTPMIVLSPEQIERERRLSMMQDRRDNEKERREKSRAAIPVKNWTDEELAKSKFNIARQLYHAGKADASKRQLEVLIDRYRSTETAYTARLVLARF